MLKPTATHASNALSALATLIEHAAERLDPVTWRRNRYDPRVTTRSAVTAHLAATAPHRMADLQAASHLADRLLAPSPAPRPAQLQAVAEAEAAVLVADALRRGDHAATDRALRQLADARGAVVYHHHRIEP